MMWALALLALNPEEQEKVSCCLPREGHFMVIVFPLTLQSVQLHQEVVSVIGEREPTYSDFDNLVYAQCVFRETLRLYPAVVGLSKRAAEGITIGEDLSIPKGVLDLGQWMFSLSVSDT